MWQIKKFKTLEKMNAWLEKRKDRIQYDQVFIENCYAVEWRKLRRVC